MSIRYLSRSTVEAVSKSGATGGGNIAHCLNSYWVKVDPTDASVAQHLLQDGFWESWVTSWFCYHIEPGTIFFDVGANSGYYTFLASELVGDAGMVYAFEPNPPYVRRLGESTKLNDTHNVLIEPFALSNVYGSGTLYVPKNLHGGASLNSFWDYEVESTHEVAVITLDWFGKMGVKDGPRMFKVDIEGNEEAFFDGGQEFLNEDVPTTIVMEYTPRVYSEGFFDRLRDYGMVTLLNYDGGESPVTREQLESSEHYQTIVIRKR